MANLALELQSPRNFTTDVSSEQLDPRFLSILKPLVTEWIKSGSYGISITNKQPVNPKIVTYSAYTIGSQFDANPNFQSYVSKISDVTLDVNKREIQYTPSSKSATTATTASTVSIPGIVSGAQTGAQSGGIGSSRQEIEQELLQKNVYGSAISQAQSAVQQKKDTTNQTKKQNVTESYLFEEINRMKKLMNL